MKAFKQRALIIRWRLLDMNMVIEWRRCPIRFTIESRKSEASKTPKKKRALAGS